MPFTELFHPFANVKFWQTCTLHSSESSTVLLLRLLTRARHTYIRSPGPTRNLQSAIRLTDFLALISFNDSGLATNKALCNAFKKASEKERATLEKITALIEF